MLYLYSENFFLMGKLKKCLKYLLGVRSRGPEAVFKSLTKGLTEAGVDFEVNKTIKNQIETACVISGVKTLSWAIEQKRLGKINHIVAGPNLVISPDDSGGILKDSLIDAIVVPSQWVLEHYAKVEPSILSKIKIWTAGVGMPIKAEVSKDLDFLVYNKIGRAGLFKNICEKLNKKGFSYKVLEYGKFTQNEYFNLLDKAKYEIYLSASESQGLAMFEAWARGVPTFIWENGQFSKDGVKITGKISAPYLTDQCGLSFLSEKEFESKLQEFLEKSYMPREYIEENYTDKISALKYFKIMN